MLTIDNDLMNAFKKTIEHNNALHQKKLAEDAREAIIEITSASFDKAAAYTNLIIVAGYAGLFSLWGFTKDILSEKATALIGISIGVSLLSFVFYEVFKMAWHTKLMLPQVKLVREIREPADFLERLRKLQIEERGKSIQVFLEFGLLY